MRRKMKQLVLVVAMLAVLVAGAAPTAAFAQQGGAPEEEIEPATKDAKEALDGRDDVKPEDEAEAGDDIPGIVGGTDVEDGTYPFMAPLLWSGSNSLACGSTLIDEDSVLTAAHCVNGGGDGKGSPVSTSDIQVAVGRTVLSSDQGELRDVSKIDIHPSYKPLDGRKYDVAVLTLDKPVTEYKPIKLPYWRSNNADGYEETGKMLEIAGWGNTIRQPKADDGSNKNGVNMPDRMQWASVPVVSDTEAGRIYGKWYEPSLSIAAGGKGKESKWCLPPPAEKDPDCVPGTGPGKDDLTATSTCQGDSGGPLFAYNGSQHVQVGISSGGYGCGVLGVPMIFTEVDEAVILEWIQRAAFGKEIRRCLPQPYEYRDENGNCVKGPKP